ncbi:unnamed protein product, partial [Linum tenue]
MTRYPAAVSSLVLLGPLFHVWNTVCSGEKTAGLTLTSGARMTSSQYTAVLLWDVIMGSVLLMKVSRIWLRVPFCWERKDWMDGSAFQQPGVTSSAPPWK